LAAAVVAVAGVLGCSAHGSDDGAVSTEQDLTSLVGEERGIHFDGEVMVPVGAADDHIAWTIARQVKTALGALRGEEVSLNDRDADNAKDPAKWTVSPVEVVDPSDPTTIQRELWRVRYRYDDRAVVTDDLHGASTVSFVMLSGDYAAHADDLRTYCSDDRDADTDSLWYHFEPQRYSCRQQIDAERTEIADERSALGDDPGLMGPTEAGRWFLPVTAGLDPAQVPAEEAYPEYHRLFDLAGQRGELIIYAYLGVDGYGPEAPYDPNDILAREAMKFYRAVLRGQPNFRPVHTAPFAWLLDVYVHDRKVEGVTYDQMLTWVIDDTDYPPEAAGDRAAKDDLRRQALAKFAERWIYWDLPIEVTQGDATKRIKVQLRSYFGREDGDPTVRQRAQWRYLEAFWHGDVFLYSGHSHFGHGPLDPGLYGSHNFNERYQIMLVNSCISFNYYSQDFIDMKPGGSQNLEVVVNGLPSYVRDGGVSTAALLLGLLSPTPKSYRQLLDDMQVDLGWWGPNYDPMRVVDGELDNDFSQAAEPLSVTVLPPVYP
jgi:hypothetical protein